VGEPLLVNKVVYVANYKIAAQPLRVVGLRSSMVRYRMPFRRQRQRIE
jgi:hypothetical protein